MDLCRQSLVFDDVAGVAACLAAVRADPEARVLRVKNRLDPGYDAGLSAGYRDVAVNVRVETAASAALGVDGHVCELQLLLQPFAEVKVPPPATLYPSPAEPLCPHRRNERAALTFDGVKVARMLPPPSPIHHRRPLLTAATDSDASSCVRPPLRRSAAGLAGGGV